MSLKQYMDVNPEVAKALEEGRPVVALEFPMVCPIPRIRRRH